MEDINLSRSELYTMVWAEPISVIAKKYEISNLGLRQLCKNKMIPIPEIGHWQKVQFGKRVFQPKLSDLSQDEQDANINLIKEANELALCKDNTLVNLENELKNDRNLQLKVPKTLVDPDQLIIDLRNVFKKNMESEYFRGGLVRSSRENLDVVVSPKNISRALLFMNTLIKALRKRDHRVTLRNGNTYVVIEGIDIQIKLREKQSIESVKHEKSSWASNVYHLTGLLYFKMDAILYEYQWLDGKQLIEERLPRILAKLELTGHKRYLERLERQKIRDAQKEMERLKQEVIQKQEKEENDFKELLQKSIQWQQASVLRSYIDILMEKTIINGTLTDEKQKWFDWARRRTDMYDPLINVETDNLDSN